MTDYRIDAATKEEWAARAFAAEAKLAMVLKAWETEDDCEEDPDYGPQSSTWWAAMHKAIAELKGGKHEDQKSDR